MPKKCGTGVFWTAVDVFIDKTKTEQNYKDDCGTKLTITENKNQPSNGYKEYIHKLPSGQYWLSGIYHHKVHQSGFPNPLYYHHTDVKVYYLEYDNDLLAPLVVAITKGSGKYDYYKKELHDGVSNKWQRETSIDKETNLAKTLNEMTRTPGIIVILKLDARTGDEYGVNGDTDPSIYKDSGMNVDSETVHMVYRRCKHTPKGSSHMRVLSTRNKSDYINFDRSIVDTVYKEAALYYWSKDTNHKDPFILELKNEDKRAYYRFSRVKNEGKGGKDEWVNIWQRDKNIKKENIRYMLDTLNCNRNKSHVVEFLQSDDFRVTFCPSCTAKSTVINIERNTVENKYKKITYVLRDTGDLIGKLVCNGQEQHGIDISHTSNTITVFFYPLENEKKEEKKLERPLLLYYGTKWYRREKEANKWKEETGIGNEGPSRIKKLLQEIYTQTKNETEPDPPYDEEDPPEGQEEEHTTSSTGEHEEEDPHEELSDIEEERIKTKLYRSKEVTDNTEKDSSHTIAIAAGVSVGILIAGLLTYESFVIRKHPRMSLTMLLMRKFKRPTSGDYLL